MKKSLIIITSLILMCIMLVGCTSSDASITTSKELNKNLNLLSNTVNRLDTIDSNYLVNSDIYNISSAIKQSSPTPNNGKTNVLASSYNVIITDTNALQDALKDEIISRIYCDEDGNCRICKDTYTCNDNNMCGSCNQTIVCDELGNCTSCNNPLYLDNDNACSTCKTNCISTTLNDKISDQTKSYLRKISDNNSNINTIQNTDSIDTELENIATDDSTPINNIDDNQEETINSTVTNIDTMDNLNSEVVNDNQNTVTDNTTETDTNNNSVEDSTEINPYSPNFRLFYFSESNFNPDSYKYSPRYVNNIDYNNANDTFNKYIEKVQKLYTITADVLEANNELSDYKVIILNNIDEARNLNDCILNGNCKPNNNQIQALNNYMDDIRTTVYNLRHCNGNLTNQINKISSTNTGLTTSIDITNSNYLKILNQIDTRISYHENALATLEQIKYLLEDVTTNNNTNNIYVEDLNNSNLQDDIYNSDSNNVIDNNMSSDNQTDEIIIDNTISDTTINTDMNNYSNIDTYKNEENTTENEVNNNIITNSDTDNERIVNNTSNNNSLVQNEEIVDYNNVVTDNNVNYQNNAPTMVDNGIANDNLNNNYNNSVITENNLDNNTNNNNYSYTDDGSLYNNVNNELRNINDNNVNTYKYNTLVDSINRGTIDNGINRL